MDTNVKTELVKELTAYAKDALDRGDWGRLERYVQFLKELSVARASQEFVVTRLPPKERPQLRSTRGSLDFPVGTVLIASTRKGDYIATVKENGLEWEGQLFGSYSELGKAVAGGKPTHLQQRKYWKPDESARDLEEDEPIVTKLRKAKDRDFNPETEEE